MMQDEKEFRGVLNQEISRLLRSHDWEEIELNFSTTEIRPDGAATHDMVASLKRYQHWLLENSAKSQVDINRISDIKLKFYRSMPKNRLDFECMASCLDDRGEAHQVRAVLG